MEYPKTYYSLEKHLEESLKYDSQFEVLNAIWKLNKKNLTSALSNVSQYFPHYSLHERSHSQTIINNIELFLGEDRIKRLSPTNTWLLLMAAYTHDLGMVVFQELIEKEWSSEEFQDFLINICEWDDDELSKSGKVLVELQKTLQKKESSIDDLMSPIQIKNSVVLVVAEYMRRIHHKRSSDILKGIDKIFYEVAHAFYSEQIPGRLLNLLGDVAYLHGVDFYEILKRLDFESNGISNDIINPRFIAAMLRLGDLLDIDDGRFNLFTTEVFPLPESSLKHKQKHSSIKHFLITPRAIEITADCDDEQVYRLARNWFDWLENEVENLNKEWSNIAPSDLTGAAPQIPKGKIKVYYIGSRANEDLLNLKFQVSNEKIFEILEGSSIYEKAEFTFIRELVQNALDASKIRFWREIEKGTYDFVFRNHFEDNRLSHQEIINRINFPKDIPDSLLSSFQIWLNIKWEDRNSENLIIEVIDRGTGISDKDLIRMTSKVGQSRKKDKDYINMIERMPFWLKPTGAFGIGLQSVFIITDTFNVYTKADGEAGKRVIFRSSKKGKYSSALDDKNIKEIGTKVQVKIPKSKFQDVFGTSFGWNIISNYDPFTDEYGNIYIHKIKQYIEEVLSQVENLNVNFFNTPVSGKITNSKDDIIPISETLHNANSTLKVLYYNDELIFDFYENLIGSQFSLRFFAQDLLQYDEYWPQYKAEFFVRDIPVESNTISYYVLSYCKLYWNFMSQFSDKILSLTREKFLTRQKNKIVNEFTGDVLKEVLPLIDSFMSISNLNILSEKFNDLYSLSVIYFKILLTLKVNNINISHTSDDLLKSNLPNFICQKKNNRKVSMKSFLNAERLTVLHLNHNIIATELLKENSDTNIIILKPSFFYAYLIKYYAIYEIEFHKGGAIIKLCKTNNKIHKLSVLHGHKVYMSKFYTTTSLSERALNYADEKYADSLAIMNQYNSGFERFPYLSDTSIISPFSNRKQLEDLIKELELSKKVSKEKILDIIGPDIVKRIVTNSLVEWVIQNKPTDITRTENDVLEGYKILICDIIHHKLNN